MYIIISERLGKLGDTFTPPEGTNIEALLEGGFIKSDTTAVKSAKTNPKTSKE